MDIFEQMKFTEKYNLNELYGKVGYLIGSTVLWNEAEIRDFLFDKGIYVESEDIAYKTGILADAYNSFKIVSYNSDFEEAEKAGLVVGITLSFRYDLKRGENGDIIFAVCHLDKDGHWSVRKVWEEA